MPIDWFTVVAQAINFLVLVWLLKRFLYKPILNAIDEREKRIAFQLAQAEAKKAEAQQQLDTLQNKNASIEQERAELMERATDEAKVERQRLLDEARKDADSLRLKRQESLKNEQSHLTDEIVRWTQKEVIAITRKALVDLASESLEERMVIVFVQRLGELSNNSREQLVNSLKRSNNLVRIRSAYDLSPAQQKLLETTITTIFNPDIRFQFETLPELVSGIELVTDGQKVAWSMTDYLATLEKRVGQILNPATTSDDQFESANGPAVELESMIPTSKVNH